MPDPIPPQKPPTNQGPGVLLTRDAAERVTRAAAFVERNFLTPPEPTRGREPRGAIVPHKIVRLTAALTARSDDTCYSAAAVVCSFNPSTGALADTAETLTVWGLPDQGVSSGTRRYFIAEWVNGVWWVGVPGSCSFLT